MYRFNKISFMYTFLGFYFKRSKLGRLLIQSVVLMYQGLNIIKYIINEINYKSLEIENRRF